MTELVPTRDAAKALGLSARSLSRWAEQGRVVPDLTTPGGHMRWNVANLRRQLDALRDRSD